ncbi:MAG: hypothetical protein E7085_07410 [Parabacteroides distasonis]|nr:hypothetical protein [Parabacteroides distasonis]
MMNRLVLQLQANNIFNSKQVATVYSGIRVLPNTQERTVYFSQNNQSEVMGELEINMDGFKPEACYFDPNGGIY